MSISSRSSESMILSSAIIEAQTVCGSDPYDAVNNPHGYISLGIAENYLVWDLLKSQLDKVSKLQEDDTHYGQAHGQPDLQLALSKMFDHQLKTKLIPDNFIITNGVTSVLDMLGYVIGESGDAVMVPAPYYPGFDIDLDGRAKIKTVPVFSEANSAFKIEYSALEKTWNEHSDKNIKAILVSSPTNPLGTVLEEAEIEAVIQFGKDKDIHVVFDEIYLFTTFPGVKSPSILPKMSSDHQKLHHIYGFSKDFSLAGYRLGTFYSHNQDVLRGMQKLCLFGQSSAPTQRAICDLISDQKWLSSFMEENSKRIQQSYQEFSKLFDQVSTLHEANAGFFAWVDLSKYLTENTFAGEKKLHQKIMEEAKVNILPGEPFHAKNPGWFRVCYANTPDKVKTACERIAKILN